MTTTLMTKKVGVQPHFAQNNTHSWQLGMYVNCSLVPSPSHTSFFFLYGCEIKAGVGRTGNENWPFVVLHHFISTTWLLRKTGFCGYFEILHQFLQLHAFVTLDEQLCYLLDFAVAT